MIDFNYTAPELLGYRLREVLANPDSPHRIGGVVYAPDRGTCELQDCEGSFSAVNRPVWRCDCGAFMTQYTDATTYHKPRFCPNCGKAVER